VGAKFAWASSHAIATTAFTTPDFDVQSADAVGPEHGSAWRGHCGCRGGTLTFGSPYADDGSTFALSCQSCTAANIVVSPTGLGLVGDGGTVQQNPVVATQ